MNSPTPTPNTRNKRTRTTPPTLTPTLTTNKKTRTATPTTNKKTRTNPTPRTTQKTPKPTTTLKKRRQTYPPSPVKKIKTKQQLFSQSPQPTTTTPTEEDKDKSIVIFKRMVSNLTIRDELLRSTNPHTLEIGPTILWIENPEKDKDIFTKNEHYDNYLSFEEDDATHYINNNKNKNNKNLQQYDNIKGSILIKEYNKKNKTGNIPVHFCAYVYKNNVLYIYDPSWHIDDRGEYSTTAFYETLRNYEINYVMVEQNQSHHWQSLLDNDVFCQTWTLEWLLRDGVAGFPLPKTNITAGRMIIAYLRHFIRLMKKDDIEKYVLLFPSYKWLGMSPLFIFDIIEHHITANELVEKF